MTFIRLFRDPGANGIASGDGNNLPPSLADVMDTGVESDGITVKPGWQRDAISGAVTRIPGYQPAPDPITGKTPEQPQQQAPPAQQQQQAPPAEGVNADGTLKPGYMRDAQDKVVKDPNYKEPAPQQQPPAKVITAQEAQNADGTLKEGFIKNADGTFAIDPDYEETGDADDETGLKYIGAVEALTGIKYDIKYPENVHPTSPEGMAFRENVIREKAAMDFEEYLKQNDPRAYAYMLHRASGGTDENFFGDQKGFQLPAEADLKASADLQTQVYTQDLLAKGLDAGTAKVLVDMAVKDNTLAAKAEAAWKLIDKAQKDQLSELQRETEKQEKLFNDNLAALTAGIANAIKTEIGFVVPEAEQATFQQYVLDNMRYDNGKFYVVQEVGQSNLKTLMESLFFQHKKGDLRTLVTKQAATKAAQTLRLRLKDTSKAPSGGSDTAPNNTKNLPLSAILPSAGNS